MEIENESIGFLIKERKDAYIFAINNKNYTIQKDESLDAFPEFFGLLFNLLDLVSNPSNSTAINKAYTEIKEKLPKLCGTISINFFSELEFYLVSLNRFSEEWKRKKGKAIKFVEIEKDQCSICLCDLYDNVETLDLSKFMDSITIGQLKKNIAIKLHHCEGHYFHIDCLIPYCKDKQFIKCPVCSFIYGTMTGDGPDGNMVCTINDSMHCKGHENCGTIVINYSMNGGKRNGVSYPPTNRTAYLPNNKGGNEVLSLLKKAFERKLIFTIGDSVTTGAKNVIVWNGIHHKSSLFGGSSNFGYPDETYFTRVKLELLDKGVKE